MTINLNLNEQSIDDAIRLVDEYRESLLDKTRDIVDDTARVAENNARQELQQHIWSGETIASLETQKSESQMTVTRVVHVGGAAIWLEFGTGVVANNCSPGTFIHPLAQELGMVGIGMYGNKHGSDPKGWYFYDEEWSGGTLNEYQAYHTYGIPATMFMYNSAKMARRYLPKIAREVFR